MLINTSITQRLGGGFGFVILILLLMAAGSAAEFQAMNERLTQIAEVNDTRTRLANELLNTIDSLAIQARTIALVVDITTFDKEVKEFDRLLAEQQEAEASLGATLVDPAVDAVSRALFSEIEAAGKATLPSIRLAVQQGASSASVDATTTLNQAVRPAETLWRGKVADFVALQKSRTARALEAAYSSRVRDTWAGIVLLVLGFGSAGLVAWWTIRGIRGPIGAAIEVAEKIASGDLSTRVESKSNDEIGRLIHAIATMQEKLRALVEQIRETADSIQVASSEVASGNADLSYRTEQAASGLQVTSASMDQFTRTARSSAESAVQASQFASSAAAVAAKGGSVVDQVVATMNEIHASSRKIRDIIGVIDGIAFQTNILALNAAVEAARAGEQGRGFAVVAGEVRNLAQRSAGAAQEIKALIENSVRCVEAGSRLVRDAGTTMGEIVASVQDLSGTISGITASANEQRADIEQMNHAVMQLDKMTQQNSALVEESAAAAESLKEQANLLARMVSAFKTEPDLQPI